MIINDQTLIQEIYSDNLEKDFEQIKSEMTDDGWILSEFTLDGGTDTFPNLRLTWTKYIERRI